MPGPTESTLIAATQTQAKPGEDREKFVTRLVRAANDLPDDKWKGLPKAVQIAVNEKAKLLNGGQPLGEFSDHVPDAAAPAPTAVAQPANPATATAPAPVITAAPVAPVPNASVAPVPAPADVATGSVVTAPAPAAAPAVAPAPVAPATAAEALADTTPAQDKKKGGTGIFRRLAAQNLDKSLKEVLQMTADQGYPVAVSTAQVIFYELRASIELMKELGINPATVTLTKAVRTPPPPRPKKQPAKVTERAVNDDAPVERVQTTAPVAAA